MTDSQAPPEPEQQPARTRAMGQWARFLPLAILLVALVLAVFVFDAGRWLSPSALSDNHERLQDWTQASPFAPLLFVLVYAVSVALSVPGATFLTLAGGLLFGFWLGTGLVAVGATLGAVLVFLAARTAFAELLRAKASGKIESLRQGFEDNAFSYLLFLRLVPLFPFWLVNIVPAVLGMKLVPYGVATFIGILPGTAVYVSVGNGLGAILGTGAEPNLSNILTIEVWLPLVALGCLSLVPVFVKRRGKNTQDEAGA